MRNVEFTPEAWGDLEYWIKQDPKVVERILTLVKECCRTPFDGIGKPEPLKFSLAGCWSRRITHDDRLVYQVTKEKITIIQLRYHY